MKNLVGIGLALVVVLGLGCASNKKSVAQIPVAPAKASPVIITPDSSLSATVSRYNSDGRFVVLNFPTGDLPKHGQVMFLYHGGLKSGEVKITGPELEDGVVADLTSGAAQVGDEVRDQ